MTSAEVRFKPGTPWTVRLFETLPIAPVWVGGALAGILITAFLSNLAALGHLSDAARAGDYRDVRIGIVMCLWVSYLPTAYVYVLSGARRTLSTLTPLLDCTPAELRSLKARIGSAGRLSRLAVGVLGAAVVAVVPLLIEPGADDAYNFDVLQAEHYWHRILGPIIGWWLFRFLQILVVESLRLSRLAARVASIDLLNLAPLAAFARQGLVNALWTMGAVSIQALTVLEEGLLGVVWRSGVVILAVALAGLVLPVRGIHRRIRDEKQAELARIRAALQGDRSGLSESGIAANADRITVADLVAYEERTERVREWPFDAPTLFRFVLYLLIPLGSWLGGAVMERLVDRLLR
jgi:hypothetical protein